ncbi:MAG: hypothetical protein HY231_09295 [Acidobacteria bacterium]|nr:hypothetical protein [Acidobacteriota bacterium]
MKRRRLTASAAEPHRLLAKVLRGARDTEVWKFTTPPEAWRIGLEVVRQLGRRRGFWEFLFDRWQKDGLLGNP